LITVPNGIFHDYEALGGFQAMNPATTDGIKVLRPSRNRTVIIESEFEHPFSEKVAEPNKKRFGKPHLPTQLKMSFRIMMSKNEKERISRGEAINRNIGGLAHQSSSDIVSIPFDPSPTVDNKVNDILLVYEGTEVHEQILTITHASLLIQTVSETLKVIYDLVEGSY
jgi:hypothetical protein